MKNIDDGIRELPYRYPTEDEFCEIKNSFPTIRVYIIFHVIFFALVAAISDYLMKYSVRMYNISDFRVWLPFGVALYTDIICYIRLLTERFVPETQLKFELTLDEVYSGNYVCTDAFDISVNKENEKILHDIFKRNCKIVWQLKWLAMKRKDISIQFLCVKSCSKIYYMILLYAY